MAVYYKFKSARDYDSIAMDGPFISVGTLKEKIFESKHLGRGTDFDLVVTNAQTNEEYLDEAMLIPKNTSVLIRRVPGRPRMPIVTDPNPTVEEKVENFESERSSFHVADSSTMKYPDDSEWDDLGGDLYEIPEVAPAQSNNVISEAPPTNIADEDSKIKALIDTPALDWQRQGPDGFGHGRGFGRGMGGRMMGGGRGFGRAGGGLERKTPPQGYVCHRCKVPGHFIQHCPTNGDPNFDIKRVKPPTGIPKSMLMATPDGSYALPSGAVAVLRPNEAAFEKEIEGLPSTRSVGDLPPELHCPLCKEVMKDAVLTSKCCFKSFCDKCIRDYIISRSMCICGATNILADDLLPNKTLRDTINRILESGNSSADNAGSTYQVQDMESSRFPQPKVQSPTMSASSKGEQKPLPNVEETPKVQETVEEAKPLIVVSQPQVEKVMMAKVPDVSEATHESMSVKEPASQGSAPLVEEEVQQRLASVDAAKKKKKKKLRMPGNDFQWKTPQDLHVDNYMMPMGMGPSTYNPYWPGGMQPGMEGYMQPFAAPMPYMGYGLGPMDMPFGGFMPQDPYAAQGCMFPGVPPQRDLADFGMGMNLAPPAMSREEFEARKADLRRKREMERRGESREFPKDRDFSREVSTASNGPMKPKPKPSERPPSPDYHRRHRPERSSVERPPRDHEPPRPPKRKSDHDYDYSHDREIADQHHHHRRRAESSGRPASESSGKAPAAMSESAAAALDRKHKTSVFARIRYPEGEVSKKQKVSSSSPSAEAAAGGASASSAAHHHHRHHKTAAAATTNGYYDDHKSSSTKAASDDHKSSSTNGYYDDHKSSSTKAASSMMSAGLGRKSHSVEYESSDDDRHFKRKPSRYEPSPPPPVVEPDEPKHSRGSRERDRTKHR